MKNETIILYRSSFLRRFYSTIIPQSIVLPGCFSLADRDYDWRLLDTGEKVEKFDYPGTNFISFSREYLDFFKEDYKTGKNTIVLAYFRGTIYERSWIMDELEVLAYLPRTGESNNISIIQLSPDLKRYYNYDESTTGVDLRGMIEKKLGVIKVQRLDYHFSYGNRLIESEIKKQIKEKLELSLPF